MKISLQLSIIFAICLLGELISSLLPISFPASVISMILMFFFLFCGILKTTHIKDVAAFLQKNMAIFFIPSSVAIIDNMEYLKGSIFIILFICAITFVLTFFVTAYTVKFVIYLQNKLGGNKNA